jgi:hypothetical protein
MKRLFIIVILFISIVFLKEVFDNNLSYHGKKGRINILNASKVSFHMNKTEFQKIMGPCDDSSGLVKIYFTNDLSYPDLYFTFDSNDILIDNHGAKYIKDKLRSGN